MEVEGNGTLIIKSSLGPGKMFITESNGSIRIETLGVMFLKEEQTSDLTSVISFWEENGRLPGIEGR